MRNNEDDDNFDDEEQPEQGPDGAAVFSLIPSELGINPLLLCLIHSFVFLDGSVPEVVNEAAGAEAIEYLATYIQRLKGAELRKVKEDMQVLLDFAKGEKWSSEQIDFLRGFLEDLGVQG
jgi:hypothetical protein